MKNTYFMAKKLMTEEQFSRYIEKLVKESLSMIPNYFNNEESNNSESDSEPSSDEGGEEGETPKQKKVRISVEKQLQRPGIDIAPYAYELEDLPITPENGDDNEHKNARSKLYKKINHKPDSNGEPQYLSPEEAIELKNELSSNLAESKKVRMNETEFVQFITESVKKSVTRILKEAKTKERR